MMNGFWHKFWKNPYKWFYMLTPTKRPFTYWLRDARQKYPTPWMLCYGVICAVIGHYFWGLGLLLAFIGLLIGIIWGHLWWGSKYIPNQQGN